MSVASVVSLQARTAGFTVLVLAQLFNALSARSESASAFIGLFANRWLWGAIALALVLRIADCRLQWCTGHHSTRLSTRVH
ncbi:cation-translocating P-type ATPase C-terminal domain-containing protein [Pseudomonas sp. LjRoot277]|uniref:cation transporting ATPase C-terminal domain-containing protein n=1 Tax=Pseudomonas sp. LjRoot277 TaxID=3342307 RepID=UPI003ED069F9